MVHYTVKITIGSHAYTTLRHTFNQAVQDNIIYKLYEWRCMDIKAFRCTYDPELSRSKSLGSKPIFSKCRTEQVATDPRLDTENVSKHTKLKLKRIVIQDNIPIPQFSDGASHPKSCLVSGFNSLVTQSKLVDVLSEYGQIDSCRVIYSQETGASLGIASVTFVDDGWIKLLKSCKEGHCTIDGLTVRAELDINGDVLAKAQRDAEERKVKSSSAQNVISDDLMALELRQLNYAQTQDWYNKYLGENPTYLLVLSKCLSVSEYSLNEVARLFRGTGYKSVVGNRTGFYATYNNGTDALRAYKDIHLMQALGTTIRVKLTLYGNRYSNEDIPKLLQTHGVSENAPKQENRVLASSQQSLSSLRAASLNASKTIRPDVVARPLDPPPGVVWATAKETLNSVVYQLKTQLWERKFSEFAHNIVKREAEKIKDAKSVESSSPSLFEGYDRSDGSGYVKSEASNQTNEHHTSQHSKDANGQRNTQARGGFGFGQRSAGLLSKATRSLSGLNVPRTSSVNLTPPVNGTENFNRYLGMPRIKKHRQYGFRTGESNMIRGSLADVAGIDRPIKVKHEQDSKTTTDDESDSSIAGRRAKSKSRKLYIVDDEAGGEIKQENTSKMSVDADMSDMEIEEEVDEEGEEDAEGNEIDTSDFVLPKDFNIPKNINFNSIRRLIKSQQDFKELKIQLKELNAGKNLPSSEADMIARLSRVKKNGLILNEDSWLPPENEQLFRFAPIRERKQLERRVYIPYYGPGIPNEIVQNNKRRLLYEEILEEPAEGDDARKESKAMNMSRNAFGSNAELFADDNLSRNAKATRLARSSIHEWGLYAEEHIPSNEFVIEYVGDVLRDEFAEIRERDYALEGIDSTYLFRLDNGTVIDATKRGNGARFINHSCDPNCTAQVFDHDGFKRVVLFSLRDIDPDEELTFDYNFALSQDEDGRVRCACGAANCRGWLM